MTHAGQPAKYRAVMLDARCIPYRLTFPYPTVAHVTSIGDHHNQCNPGYSYRVITEAEAPGWSDLIDRGASVHEQQRRQEATQ